jgi:hypothetical protein
MRVMKHSNGSTLNVAQHIILGNFWEYYLESTDEDGIAFGLVMGFENELGHVDMKHIGPYAASIASGDELEDIMPAEGWEWADE